jgi:hypothetical protein
MASGRLTKPQILSAANLVALMTTPRRRNVADRANRDANLTSLYQWWRTYGGMTQAKNCCVTQ